VRLTSAERILGAYAGVYGEDYHGMHSVDLQEAGMYRTTEHGHFVLGSRVSYEYDPKSSGKGRG
jgi:hypothetical protein